MPSPLTINLISNAALAVSSTVVLGIAAYVEHSTRNIGYSSSTYTYDAFVGAFTLLVLFGLVLLRFAKPSAAILKAEVGASGLLWVFWLASGISTTHHTRNDRSVCKHIDDLFDLPEFADADPDALAMIKKIFKSTCRDLRAQLAFVWIGFVILTFTLGYLVYLATKGGNKLWNSTLRTYGHDERVHDDPFADPVGREQGPVVGVAGDPDFKP